MIMIGGDHNCTLNSNLDRRNCLLNEGDVGKEEIQSMCNELLLEDVWRRRNPDTFEYTCSSGQRKSRIDYWLISSALDKDSQVEHLNPPMV